jgi:hypothetical protein
MPEAPPPTNLEDALIGLRNGDFTRLNPLFEGGVDCLVLKWWREGGFAGHDDLLAEAFTCACFNGRILVAERLLEAGVAADGGILTGMNAFHWAVNRGQTEIVHLLLDRRASFDTPNRFGGNVVDTVLWSAVHEPKTSHLAILEMLLNAGARPSGQYETGLAEADRMLARYS